MGKILVVEDEVELNRLIVSTLKQEGFEVIGCFNGEEGLNEFSNNQISIILSDVLMPKLDGYEFAKAIRKIDKKVPIIFLTAKDDKSSKHYAYGLGIDDYLVKPFDLDELILKIKAIERRIRFDESNRIQVGNLVLDKDEHVAYVNEKELQLSAREFDILFKMLSYPKKTFTRSNLMNEFWDFDTSATSRTVDVYMSKLREKTALCDGFKILTIHGLGYKVVLNED